MSIYKVSPHVRVLRLDEQSALVGHPFFLEYSVLEQPLLEIFTALLQQPRSVEQLRDTLDVDPESIDGALKFFRTRHFIVQNEDDEESEIKRLVSASRNPKPGDRSIAGGSRFFRDYTALDLKNLKNRIPTEHTRKLKFLILGGCLAQLAANALEQSAPSYGIESTVEANWPDRIETLPFDGTDVIVFQPFTLWLIAPFWDGAPFVSEEERDARVETMKEYLKITLQTVLPRTKGRLLLVQGISTPILSPFGAAEFRQRHSFRRVVNQLNDIIIDAIKDNPDAAFIDEEQLLANAGKLKLMDDSIALAGHHGPIDSYLGTEPVGPSRDETFGVEQSHHAPRLFARAYLDAYVRWAGLARVKCIIVDLDNTLWPGVAGEEGFNLADESARIALWTGVFAGIHQALKVLKQQGILLAIASRQNEPDVDQAWQQIESFVRDDDMKHLLTRDDFVIRKINWERKSANIAEILDALGVAPDAALFIDDNPAERAEIQTVFPKLRLLGENIHLIRSILLTDPCLQKDMQTAESTARTAMVKAQLERDSVRKQTGDGLSFLRSLNITLKITRVRSLERIAIRLTELIQRTNQFNTTLTRYSGHELNDFINLPQGAIYTLEVADRFASYGLVGVCLLWNGEVANFIMSCRVIPLGAAVPFLSAALQDYDRTPVRASITEGPRNQPCRTLYADAGFETLEPHVYELKQLSNLKPIDPSIHHTELYDGEERFARERSELKLVATSRP